jgi:hypothetical protein
MKISKMIVKVVDGVQFIDEYNLIIKIICPL